MHWVDVPEGEERISFGFLRTQHAKEFILQYKGRILYKMQVLLMTDEFELAISNAKHIVPGEDTLFCIFIVSFCLFLPNI